MNDFGTSIPGKSDPSRPVVEAGPPALGPVVVVDAPDLNAVAVEPEGDVGRFEFVEAHLEGHVPVLDAGQQAAVVLGHE